MLPVFSVYQTVLVADDVGPRRTSAFVASTPVVLAILERLNLVHHGARKAALACAALSTSACRSTGKKDVGVDAIRSSSGQECILYFPTNFSTFQRRHHLIGAVRDLE